MTTTEEGEGTESCGSVRDNSRNVAQSRYRPQQTAKKSSSLLTAKRASHRASPRSRWGHSVVVVVGIARLRVIVAHVHRPGRAAAVTNRT
jgi:hypothetical protein